jgi:hypothetical protein
MVANSNRRRQELNDWALLGANLLLVIVSLVSLRRDGLNIATMAAVAAAVVAFTLLMFWRRYKRERSQAD